MSHDGQVIATSPVRARLRYDARLGDRAGARAARQRGHAAPRAAPAGRTPTRARSALAAQWRAESAGDDAVLARALAVPARRAATPTRSSRALLGRHSVDDFLFDTREGFCEHFASAFVFLMRAAGIPARVVTGYQGGELNPVDSIITVRQSDAHAWAEVFLARPRLGARRSDRGGGARARRERAWRAPCRRARRCR